MKKRILIALVVVLALAATASLVWASSVGLVSYWPFDEGSGSTAYDATINGNDGTVYGAMYVGGKVGQALSFDGTNDYVSVDDSASLNFGTGDFTIGAWIKLTNTNHLGQYYGIFDKGQVTPAAEGRYSLFITPWNTLRLHIGHPGLALFWRDSTLTISDTDWHYIAVSVDRDGNAIFAVDSTTETAAVSASSSYNTSSTTSATIGVRVDVAKWWFDGLIDEVGIWDRALSAEEIAALARAVWVDDDGVECPWAPYTTIQDAVDDAGVGDTILVCDGSYNEQVNVNKDVTVQAAAGLDRPVVVGSPKAFNITADDATVEGFEARQPASAFGVGNDVIMVYDADRVTVKNNKVKGAGPYITWQDKNPGPGITVLISDHVTIEGNHINDTTGAGIWFGSSTNSTIRDNSIVDTQYTGILLPNWIGMGPSHDNTIEGNSVRSAGNPWAVWDDGIRLGAGAYDNTVEDNRVNGSIKDGIRAVGSTHDNTIQYNRIRGSGTGPTGGVDAHDQAPVGNNTWTGNSCRTSDPDGLCD